jgi:hypothetical protein
VIAIQYALTALILTRRRERKEIKFNWKSHILRKQILLPKRFGNVAGHWGPWALFVPPLANSCTTELKGQHQASRLSSTRLGVEACC